MVTKHYSFYADTSRCVGCYSCMVACKQWKGLPPDTVGGKGPRLMRLNIVESGKHPNVTVTFVPIPCMHCVDPPCVKACPTNAISKNSEDGTTQVDQEKCIGCRFCLWACPYGAPQFPPKDSPLKGKMILCNLCIDRLKEGKKTACEAACPAGAIHVDTTEEVSKLIGYKAAKRISKEQVSPLL